MELYILTGIFIFFIIAGIWGYKNIGKYTVKAGQKYNCLNKLYEEAVKDDIKRN